MGLTFLELEVANLARPDVAEKLEFLIDSGAIYSVLPAAVLDRLGIEPMAEQEFRLANGAGGKKGCAETRARFAARSSTISACAPSTQPAQVTRTRGSRRMLRIQSDRKP